MKLKLYLSKQGYKQKPDKAAGMIKQVKSYVLTDIEVEELYNKLINGHFIHHECGYSEPNSGGKAFTFKKSLLKQTQIIGIDLDYKFKYTKSNGDVVIKEYSSSEMPEWTNEILSDLKYKNRQEQEIDISPTFWMESFSAHTNTEKKIVGNSIHLFYVFYDNIYNVSDYEKISTSIIYAIYQALKCKGYDIPLEPEKCPFDPVSTDMFQAFWGSFDKAHGYNGHIYWAMNFKSAYVSEMKNMIFQKKADEVDPLTDDEIKRTISAYSTVETIDDIDINKSQYIKYKEYFGHQEGFHIISVLKHEYAKIEGVDVINSKQSLCYQVCKKLLLGHCNDFFDSDESYFYNEYRRCKMYNKKGTNEAAYMNHVIRLIGDTGAIPLIKYKEEETNVDKVIKLNKKEYLGDRKSEIIKMLDNEKINFIIADPGLGKTVFAKSLEGRTLIIELYNSIIQSEEKFDSGEFIKFIEDFYIKYDTVHDLNVCSANKFCFWYKNKDINSHYDFTYDNTKCLFDNIILDESHLLCLSNYRYDIMGETVECLKNIKLEYPEVNIIIMTGTPFGENTIFDNLNTITIEAEPRYNKKFYMIQTSSIEGYMKELIKDTLSKGLRVFIPVDSENWFDTFIEACVKDDIISKDKCYYFNQPKNTEETEKYILNTKLIGDIQVLGTSSYMSVGIDLEDWKTEFVTIIPSGASMTGNFSGIEVEQFANRHRKQNLEVHYVISMNESNNKKPFLQNSCRALLNIKNELLKKLYKTNPIVIKLPMYISKNNETLEVHEDMFNVFVYYKDMQHIISHPMNVYEYMQKKQWTCEWKTVENTHRGINTKEHRDLEKANGVTEFMELLEEWAKGNYPLIKVHDSISGGFKIIPHRLNNSLFDLESIEVQFTNYYAKNKLFSVFLNIREYLTGLGTYNLIKDAYDGVKINMSYIEKSLLSIKLINNFVRTGLWKTIYDRLSEFYSSYSTWDNCVYTENRSEYKQGLDNTVQQIWDELSNNIDDEMLQRAFKANYDNVTENLITDFMDGVKLVQGMYLEIKTMNKKINKKTYKANIYNWNDNKMGKYEIRTDKKNDIKTNIVKK